jgi:Peptidase family M28
MPRRRYRPRAWRPAASAAAILLLTAAFLPACGGGEGSSTTVADRFDADRAFTDLESQVALGPRPTGSAANRRATRRLASELRRAGIGDVRIQRPLRNVVGTIPGRGPGYVVVAAHHDTKDIPGFVGANDGASGVAVVLELVRSLPDPLPGASLAIALFDGEEARGERPFSADGTRGSRQYVELARRGAQGTPPLAEIRAMVLFDMVGDCDLAIPREASSDAELYGAFADADGQAFEGETGPIGDDHVPFLDAGIPAVDLIDFDFGPGETPGGWWHTTEDDLDHVCPDSLDAVGEAALSALPTIAGRP